MPGYKGNPELIFIKKSRNFTIVDSGWRYWSVYNNREFSGLSSGHGVHWAVLKTPEGKSFIITVGHYGDGRYDNMYAKEHQAAIQTAQAASGANETLPTVATGDFYTPSPDGACYLYHTSTCGFTDPQTISAINCNRNVYQSTCHSFAKPTYSGTRYDFILHNYKFTPLKFKVLKSMILDYASDHYPVCVDLKFK